jgi:hypothetical protein
MSSIVKWGTLVGEGWPPEVDMIEAAWLSKSRREFVPISFPSYHSVESLCFLLRERISSP